MFQKSRSALRRNAIRIGAGAGVVLATTLALPGIASAHVSIEPGTVEGGEGAVIAVRVPNERDDASTTSLKLVLPVETPIGSVRTTEMPGWKATTATRKLTQPIDVFGRKVDTVVSQVTWTSTDGVGIRPGQYKDFNLSLGPLPESGELVFSAVQTYAGGQTVSWNEVSADKTTEPEHPAPVLEITPEAGVAGTAGTAGTAGADSGAGKDASAGASGFPTTAVATPTAADATGTASLALSGAALAVSVFAAVLAWRRGRPAAAASGRRAPAATATERAPEDARP